MTTPMTDAGHSPLPWRSEVGVIVSDTPRGEHKTIAVAYVGDEFRHIAGLTYGSERDANAELIVKSVNGYESALARVAVLEKALADLLALPVASVQLSELDKGIGTKTINAAWLRARVALSDLGGRADE